MRKLLFAVLTLGLTLLSSSVMAQRSVTIAGTVTDEAGNPLAGANVFLKDTHFGAAADEKGRYSFALPPQLVRGQKMQLVARFIGYRSQSVTITLTPGTITHDFKLPVDVLELESVVVTGMGGSQIKEKLGVSIAKVQPALITRSAEPNVVEALAGKAPGVEVTATSGDPGTNSFIRIRGAGSISRTTQPLFVVDGVPISNRTDYNMGANGGTETTNRAADINTEDIASVEILKGAAAAAIYGSRAANGVVIITTKSGRPGRTKISYKLSIGASTQSKFYPLQTWFGQGTKGKFVKNYSRSWGRPLNVKGSPYYDPSKPEDKVYDHGREITGTGWSNENNFTISGGRGLTTFFLSFGRLYQKGHWKAGSDYERYTGRLKATQTISSKLRLTANVAYANTRADYLQRGDNAIGLMLGALRTPPEFNNLPYLDPVTGFHRSYRYSDATVLRKSRKFNNPFWTMYEGINKRGVGRLYGYVKADFDPFDWVNINYTLGSDYYNDDAIYVEPPGGSRNDGNGQMRRSDFIDHEIDGNLIITINADKFLKKFRNIGGTLMLGQNFNSRKYSRLEATGNTLGAPGFFELDNAVSITTNEFKSLIHTESFFGQATVDLFEQLYLTGALRNDGSSTFGVSQKRHWYPKFSAAWEFTKLATVPALDFGKLRFAFGEAGVQPGVYTTISAYRSGFKGFGLFTSTNLNLTYRGKSGYVSSANMGNNDVKPERTKELEFGVDLAFLKSRIGLNVTRYLSRSTDVLFDRNVVPSTGYFSQTANAATIENRGWEASLDIAAIRKRNFSWNLGLNWARNRNMVTAMYGAKWVQIGRWAYAAAGHELGELRLNTWVRFGYGMKVDGVDIDKAYSGWKKGDVYIPEDGYPIMSPEPIWSGLSANPKWTGSIRNEFTLFKNFTVSAFVDIVQGNYIMNHGAGALFSYGTHKGTEDRGQVKSIPLTGKFGTGPDGRTDIQGFGPGAIVVNGKSVGKPVELTEAWYRSAGAGFSGDGFQFTEDGSYIKLREVSVSYRLRNKFVNSLGLSDIVFRLSGRNVRTWTDYTGFDPESNRQQATGARDSDYFNQPQTRSFLFTMYVNY